MIAGASIGNALEFYDFIVYGFFATQLSATFFPGKDPTARLLLTFGVFGVSFFARPVGALVLGHFADRKGRVATMILCVLLMTLASAAIALMPAQVEIGLAAPVGILLARLLQGFALGGEFGSATALMIEHASGAETRAASWQGISQNFAGLFASGIAWALSSQLASNLPIQPFRIAFGLGALAGPVALLLRRNLTDAPAFLALRDSPPRDQEHATPSGILIAAAMVAIGTAQTYLTIYLPTYATSVLHMQAGRALGPVFLNYVMTLAITPWRLSIARRFDRSHRAGPMLGSCVAMLILGYPAFILLGLWPGSVMLFLISIGFTVIGMYYNAPLSGFMGMVFSLQRRGLGLSIGYALGIAAFGGSAPFINTWLVARTGDPRSPGLYLAFASIVSMGAIVAARRRLTRRSRAAA
jgi:MHS family proline/betaine transporter-like MFS transporter